MEKNIKVIEKIRWEANRDAMLFKKEQSLEASRKE